MPSPPCINEFIIQRTHCEVPLGKTTFGQTVLSVNRSKYWNSLPVITKEHSTCSTKPYSKPEL